MPDEQDFPEQDFPDEPQRPHASASPQIDAAQAGLHVAKLTDHRDFDIWSTDEGVCQRFLIDKPATWRTAIQRYWRERCTRRALASELGVDLETAKNLLRRIRKAARDFQNGTITIRLSRHEDGVRYPGRPHSGINARDIESICDGDEDALAHMEEYGRLNIIERLTMFSSAISGELIKTFEHSEAIGDSQRENITSRLVAKADALKAKVVKPDPFIDRPLFSIFPDQRTSMRIPETEGSRDGRLAGLGEVKPNRLSEAGHASHVPKHVRKQSPPRSRQNVDPASYQCQICALSHFRRPFHMGGAFTWVDRFRNNKSATRKHHVVRTHCTDNSRLRHPAWNRSSVGRTMAD